MLNDHDYIFNSRKTRLLEDTSKLWSANHFLSQHMQTQTCTFHLLKRISIPAHGHLGTSQLLLGYNQQLSTSQIHKQSFVLLHWVFFCFFPLTGEWKERKKKRSRQRDFVPSSIGFFPFTAEQMPRGWWRLWAYAAGTAFRCSWSPELMTAQPLQTFSKSCFSLGRRVWNIHLNDRTLLPTSCIQLGRVCSLSGRFFHLLHSTLSLSPFSCCGEQHNCQLCMGYREDRLVEPSVWWHPVPRTASCSSGCCDKEKIIRLFLFLPWQIFNKKSIPKQPSHFNVTTKQVDHTKMDAAVSKQHHNPQWGAEIKDIDAPL